jgi:multicomponent Na+:H+ antiporter subunit D
MEMVCSYKPLLAILVSLAASALILLTGKRPNLRESWTILAAGAKFLIVLSMAPSVLNGEILEYTMVTLTPGICLQLRVDALGLYFGLLASGLWIATSIYSIGYMRGLQEHAQTRYFFCFAIALSATIGVAFSANLLTLFLFYEILTISTYPLVAHKETPEALAAGRKYLAYLLTSAAIILFSITYTYHLAGSLDFVGGGFLVGLGSPAILRLLFVTFILGFGTKAAFMPIHEWLPTAMIAPTPVSALLHAVAVVKAGVFCCLRVIDFVFGPSLLSDLNLWLILCYFVSCTIIGASLLALAQDNLKRRLAFSTISQLSYIVLGAALITPSALLGSILHIAFHGFMKITLFFCAGAIFVKTGKENISEMNGIGRQMPLTLGAFAVGAIGMAGIPPACGFLSKWYLCLGSLEAGEMIFVLILLTSSLLNVAYFFPIVYRAFFKKAEGGDPARRAEASWWMLAPILACALMSIIFGLNPDAFVRFHQIASLAVANILGLF